MPELKEPKHTYRPGYENPRDGFWHPARSNCHDAKLGYYDADFGTVPWDGSQPTPSVPLRCIWCNSEVVPETTQTGKEA